MNESNQTRKILLRLIPLLILAGAIVIIAVVFWVREVKVTGNTRHTSDEISAVLLSGTLEKNTLYLMWKFQKGDILEQFPYLDSMEMKMEDPGTVTVHVAEKEPVGYFDREEYVYFDENGMVLEVSEEEKTGIPVVTGLSIGDPVLYQKIPAESESQLQAALKIIKTLGYHKLAATEIRFNDELDITVMIGHTEVLLGKNEYLDEKIANLKAILDTMEKTAGTLHMENFTGKNEPVTFSDAGMPETEEPHAADQDGEGEGSILVDGQNYGVDGQEPDEILQEEAVQEPEAVPEPEPTGVTFMVFNSSGTLLYDARVVNGQVVDSYGNPIDGCYVNEAGNAVDAYMNEIDPNTGTVLNLQ